MADHPSSSVPDAGRRDEAESDYRRARARLDADDLDGAAHWLEQAAAKEHPAALTELAILHLHGFGREADPAHARELLLRAECAGGTPETSWLLALLAVGGIVIDRDTQHIDAWLVDSARRGYAAALRVAGLCFGRNDAVVFQRAAATCLERATAARDPVGAALLADRLHAGRGIPRNAERAQELAAQLRAIGIPVELPPHADGPEIEAIDPGFEPPWDDLHAFAEPPSGIVRQCENPEVATCDGLLNDEECRYLVYSGARYIERSRVIHPDTGRMLEFGVRTSQDMTFAPTLEDVGVRILQLRMAELAGFDLAHCESLTLLRYGPGDEYRPHRDYFPPSAPQLAQPGGQRHSTVCTYLNDVEDGGETVFPDKNLTVRPLRGRAVMFRSLHDDGSPDPHSLHAGLPVRAGEKWLASCWIRVRELRQH